MATSNDYVLERTANQIIESALRRARIIPVEQSISDSDRDTALEALNNMIKRFQAKGYMLWKQEEYILPTEKGKQSYYVGASGDRCALADTFIFSELSAAVTAAATQITIADTSDFTGADNVLTFDPTDAVADWSTTDGTLAAITAGLRLTSTVPASEGYTEYTFTDQATIGREYFFQVDVDSLGIDNVRLEVYDVGLTTTLNASEVISATGEQVIRFTPEQNTIIFRFVNEDTTGAQVSEFSNLQLRDTTTGETIGIYISNALREWNSVTRVIDGTTLELLNAQTNDAASAASVWAFKNLPPRPLAVNLMRSIRNSDTNEIPVNQWSRSEYMEQVNKTSEGLITQAYYQPTLTNGRLYVWQVSDSVNQYMRFNAFLPIQVFNESLDEPDFPSEWFDALSWNLAAEIAPEYGVPLDRQQYLEQKAAVTLGEPEDWDEEQGSLYIGVRRNAQN